MIKFLNCQMKFCFNRVRLSVTCRFFVFDEAHFSSSDTTLGILFIDYFLSHNHMHRDFHTFNHYTMNSHNVLFEFGNDGMEPSKRHS